MLFLGPICSKKGSPWAKPKMIFFFFCGQNKKSRSSAFTLYFIKRYVLAELWIFFHFVWCFLSERVISSENSCELSLNKKLYKFVKIESFIGSFCKKDYTLFGALNVVHGRKQKKYFMLRQTHVFVFHIMKVHGSPKKCLNLREQLQYVKDCPKSSCITCYESIISIFDSYHFLMHHFWLFLSLTILLQKFPPCPKFLIYNILPHQLNLNKKSKRRKLFVHQI